MSRMHQLSGAMRMTRVGISGHERAAELAAERRREAEGRPTMKIADAAEMFRVVEMEGRGGKQGEQGLIFLLFI